MPPNALPILGLCAGLVIGFGLAFWLKVKSLTKKVQQADDTARQIVNEANIRAESLLTEAKLEAKEKLFKMKAEFDVETKEAKDELKKIEMRLLHREENFDRKLEQFERRDREINRKEKQIQQTESDLEKSQEKLDGLVVEQRKKLESLSGLTAEQAKDLLIRAMENEARYEGAKFIKRIENETKEEADKKAKKIIATAIQRYAGDYVAERTVSVVQLPNDEMKGRIIGREGRNIRALEAATGIDLIIDDTPEAVILSGFNPVRREVARLSLIKLISDGRIHPARIEDVVKKVGQEVDTTIKEAGEQATFDLGVHGIHPDLVKHLGR